MPTLSPASTVGVEEGRGRVAPVLPLAGGQRLGDDTWGEGRSFSAKVSILYR